MKVSSSPIRIIMCQHLAFILALTVVAQYLMYTYPKHAVAFLVIQIVLMIGSIAIQITRQNKI